MLRYLNFLHAQCRQIGKRNWLSWKIKILHIRKARRKPYSKTSSKIVYWSLIQRAKKHTKEEAVPKQLGH